YGWLRALSFAFTSKLTNLHTPMKRSCAPPPKAATASSHTTTNFGILVFLRRSARCSEAEPQHCLHHSARWLTDKAGAMSHSFPQDRAQRVQKSLDVLGGGRASHQADPENLP